MELSSILELRNALEIAETIILSALKDVKVRCHYREDYPLISKSSIEVFVKELKEAFLEFHSKKMNY